MQLRDPPGPRRRASPTSLLRRPPRSPATKTPHPDGAPPDSSLSGPHIRKRESTEQAVAPWSPVHSPTTICMAPTWADMSNLTLKPAHLGGSAPAEPPILATSCPAGGSRGLDRLQERPGQRLLAGERRSCGVSTG